MVGSPRTCSDMHSRRALLASSLTTVRSGFVLAMLARCGASVTHGRQLSAHTSTSTRPDPTSSSKVSLVASTTEPICSASVAFQQDAHTVGSLAHPPEEQAALGYQQHPVGRS